MSGAKELYQRMKADPDGPWTIADVQTVCEAFGVACKASRTGSHFIVSHPKVSGHLTMKARSSVKPLYIGLLIEMVDSLGRQ